MGWPMIRKVIAEAFYGGGRRWFTLDAACKAEANNVMRKALSEMGEETANNEWFFPRRNRLAGLYKARWKRLNNA